MLIEKARELGVLLAQSPEYIRMREARQAVDENEAVSAMLEEFTVKRERLMSSLSSDCADAADAVALTNDLERLKEQLSGNPDMSELIASEQAFSDLLKSVNEEISSCIEVAQSSSCGGDCASCGGCRH